jgi:hypothetical protein
MDTPTAATVPRLPLAPRSPSDDPRWFCRWGCVVSRGDAREVWVGGTLVGTYSAADRERGPRNLLLVTLAGDPSMHLGHLAAAFEVSDEHLRQLRRKAEAEGLGAIASSRRGGPTKVSREKREQLRAWFAEGWTPTEVYKRQSRHGRLSRATISRERARWQTELAAAAVASSVAAATETVAIPAAAAEPPPEQLSLFVAPPPAITEDDRAPVDEAEVDPEATATASEHEHEEAAADVTAADESGAVVPMRSRPVQSGRSVQHLGTWLMLGLAKRDGLYDAMAACGARGDAARIATDATIAALAIGEGCVEGVRRLQTPTAPTLLRADRTPTASGVRRRLWALAEANGAALMAAMSERYIVAARGSADEPAVFYVDNHLRPYTGQEVVRKGWRMQDRRVLPGTSDYYVHDEDGRPAFRIDVPSHDSLTQWLMPIAKRLRAGLGSDERILIAFDRGGAYAEQLAALRNAGFEFVTYERKPYPELPDRVFDRTIRIRGEEYRVHESRLKNLGAGRGRLRRIALRSPDGAQINLVAISTAPLERLVAILVGDEDKHEPSGRWRQENAFKHGVERWGLNQLDGRRVDDYPPDTIIPNPARRRLDRALRLARAEEGAARCALAALDVGSPRRERVERELEEAIARRVEIELQRPFHPPHAPLAETELAGKLVRHTGELKAVVDTIRIVCANAETDLAVALAPWLRRPREAKKVIANLLAAPGRIDVTPTEIRIRLAPAANRSERAALDHLLAEVSRWNLTLPGDARCRPIRVQLQQS